MDPFVKYANQLIKMSTKMDNITLVIGNESCDLDSTISALTYAYFLHKVNNSKTKTVFPVLNISKNEFLYRTENSYVLNNVGIKPEQLIYGDVIDVIRERNLLQLEVVLVDHHVVSKRYDFLKDSVKHIFDHRPLDSKADWKQDVTINRELVGSCCTLIANEILQKDSTILTPIIAKVLYETIIFDTIGLSEEAGKVKQLDISICQELEKYLAHKPTPSKLFEELWAAHNDVSNLTVKQLLLKDLKIINNILIPGLPMLVKEFLKYSDALEHLHEICFEKSCEIAILMGLEAKGGKAERDIALYSIQQGDDLLDKIFQNLYNYSELELERQDSDHKNVVYCRQNPKISRKQIIPRIQEVLQQNN